MESSIDAVDVENASNINPVMSLVENAGDIDQEGQDSSAKPDHAVNHFHFVIINN